jgi:hypothetical protein
MIDLKTLFTRYTTLFTTAIFGFAQYWINFMDDSTKQMIIDALGAQGKWVAPTLAYVAWLGLRAKSQPPQEPKE